MTNEERKKAMYNQGRADALELQERAPAMTGTELNAQEEKIPSFVSAVANDNMLNRAAGDKNGFVCRSSAGRVVRLIQNYDSTIFTQEPEDLPAQWRFVWSQDPAKAKPFISLSTSPYGEGDCCIEDGVVYRSTMDGNIHAPSAYKQGWEAVVG